MFFLNSVSRRLVTGMAVLLGLMLIVAGLGILALVRHQQAVSDLDYVLYESPDPVALSICYDEIALALEESSPANTHQTEVRLRTAIKQATDQLGVFQTNVEQIKLKTRELRDQRLIVIGRLRAMRGILDELNSKTPAALNSISDVPENARDARSLALRGYVLDSVHSLKTMLVKLPEYQDPDNLRQSLYKEQTRSAKLLRFVLGMTAAAIVFYGVMVYFAFRWISNPISTISKGASRIAEGDTDFRIPQISGWNDEFSSLRSNVNLMADRFQEAEEDLNAKVGERSRQLVRSERLAGLGFLAAGVAHEINNPLSAIRLASDSLEYRLHDSIAEDDPDRKEILDRLAMIRRESARCGEITARILNFARGDESTFMRDCLTRVVEEVLAMIRPMPAYQDREVVFERTEPLMVEMNPSQMKQVILNLVANSLQATPADGRVELRLNQQVDWVVLEVEDNGCGMSAETLNHLFEPFYSTKQAGLGTGLGMSITHRIIERHHGTIEPISQGMGKGSLFRVRLPVRQAERIVA